MACNADRIEKYGTSWTLSDLSACVSISRSVSLRVVCIQVLDATTGGGSDRDERRLLPRRQALPVVVASFALPVAAASLALAAAPLLRRLPDRLLSPGTVSRVRPMLPGARGHATRIRRSSEPLPLDAGRPVPDAAEETSSQVDAVISADTAGVVAVPPAVERELVAPTGLPS